MAAKKRYGRYFLIVVGLLMVACIAVFFRFAFCFCNISYTHAITTKVQIQSLDTAIALFKSDVGRNPKTTESLQVLVEKRLLPDADAKRWTGPYIRYVPKDGWGNAYHYQSPSAHGAYEIVSYGADGKPGGAGYDADINSWELEKP